MDAGTTTRQFWDRPRIEWALTAALGFVFFLAFLVYVVANFIHDDLLDPALYSRTLDDNDIYDRIYTELLADPELQDTTKLLLGDINIGAGTTEEVYSFTVSTLRLLLPPETIQTSLERVVDEITAYLKGDTEKLEGVLSLSDALNDPEFNERLISSINAFTAELILQAESGVESVAGVVDVSGVQFFVDSLADGELSDIPTGFLTSIPVDLTDAEREEIATALFDAIDDILTDEVRLQIEAALAADDVPGALSVVIREVLQDVVDQGLEALQEQLNDDETINGLTELARLAEETEQEILGQVNTVRTISILLRDVGVPLATLIMAASLGGVVWVHNKPFKAELRIVSSIAVITGILILVIWVIVLVALNAPFEDLTNPETSSLPSSLRQMLEDILISFTEDLFAAVWRTAAIPLLLGGLLLGLTVVVNFSDEAVDLLRPVFQHPKTSVSIVAVTLIVVPAIIEAVLDETLPAEAAEPTCNGFAELCDRPYDEVVYVATHNSMSVSTQGWVWPLHDISMASQLKTGVRAFLIDTLYYDDAANAADYLAALPEDVRPIVSNTLDSAEFLRRDGVFVCHGLCTLGFDPLEEILTTVHAFMVDNPREVITLLIQDEISPEDTEAAFENSGLIEFIYRHDGGAWPTLGDMIASGERLVVMAENEGPPPDWYLNMWEQVEETPYLFKTPGEMTCDVNRGGDDKDLLLLNHWIDRISPDRVDAARINDYDFLLDRARLCAEIRQQKPNFVAVNFTLIGDVFDVVNELNDVDTLNLSTELENAS